MKRIAILFLAVPLVGCTAVAGDTPAEMSAAATTEFAEALAGYRQAGPPMACVSQRDLRGNRSIGEQAILFEGRGRDTVYVNQPPAGCPELKFNRVLITRTPSTRLCQGDIATVADLVSGTQFGGCGLGEFTPYRRVR